MIHRPISLLALVAASAALAACQTTDTAPPETITWDKPPAEAAGKPAPTVPAAPQPPVARGPGEPQCREYQTTITIGGVPKKAYGRACRQPDGTWKDENVLRDQPYSETPPARVENIHPYGWHGYHYPEHPYYGRGGLSIGVGAGTRGGYMGYGVGF